MSCAEFCRKAPYCANSLAGGEPLLQRVGEFGRAVECHAQAVVEFAKVRVGGDIAGIDLRVEVARLEPEVWNMHAQQN